jgi:hypothetical protein
MTLHAVFAVNSRRMGQPRVSVTNFRQPRRACSIGQRGPREPAEWLSAGLQPQFVYEQKHLLRGD